VPLHFFRKPTVTHPPQLHLFAITWLLHLLQEILSISTCLPSSAHISDAHSYCTSQLPSDTSRRHDSSPSIIIIIIITTIITARTTVNARIAECNISSVTIFKNTSKVNDNASTAVEIAQHGAVHVDSPSRPRFDARRRSHGVHRLIHHIARSSQDWLSAREEIQVPVLQSRIQ